MIKGTDQMDCKFYNDGYCTGTKEQDPCRREQCEKWRVGKEDERDLLLGVSPDEPVVVNECGGKQSDTPYGFHLLPINAVFAAARVAKYGADKYGETLAERNYTKIPTEDHINHCIQHLYAYLAGDKQDDHLGHAIVRAMFAYDTALRNQEKHNE